MPVAHRFYSPVPETLTWSWRATTRWTGYCGNGRRTCVVVRVEPSKRVYIKLVFPRHGRVLRFWKLVS
ncbi:hypothetical protein EXIGLDRAFT_723994, partial [Exidia glandulosa HHB12029]